MATAKKEILNAFEFNGETGEATIRPLSQDELAQREIDVANTAIKQTELESRIAARESALAKLADLGLTAEEIAAL